MESFVQHTDLEGTAHKGINWGVREIFDIFEALGTVAGVVKIKVCILLLLQELKLRTNLLRK